MVKQHLKPSIHQSRPLHAVNGHVRWQNRHDLSQTLLFHSSHKSMWPCTTAVNTFAFEKQLAWTLFWAYACLKYSLRKSWVCIDSFKFIWQKYMSTLCSPDKNTDKLTDSSPSSSYSGHAFNVIHRNKVNFASSFRFGFWIYSEGRIPQQC